MDSHLQLLLKEARAPTASVCRDLCSLNAAQSKSIFFVCGSSRLKTGDWAMAVFQSGATGTHRGSIPDFFSFQFGLIQVLTHLPCLLT